MSNGNNQNAPQFAVTLQQPQQGHAPDGPVVGNEAPARVRVALEFLNDLSLKRVMRAAVNDWQIQLIEGEELTTAEANARATACNMLNDYFLGKMRTNSWEREYVENSRETMMPPPAQKLPPEELVLLPCPLCLENHGVRSGCPVCKGCGNILARAAERREE